MPSWVIALLFAVGVSTWVYQNLCEKAVTMARAVLLVQLLLGWWHLYL